MGSKVMHKVEIFYNDDILITDYLADLKDRTDMIELSKELAKNKNIRACLVTNHKAEEIVTVILCNAPFDFNKDENILMLFTCSGVAPLMIYFQKWIECESYDNKEQRSALLQILGILDDCRESIDFEQTQSNHMG